MPVQRAFQAVHPQGQCVASHTHSIPFRQPRAYHQRLIRPPFCPAPPRPGALPCRPSRTATQQHAPRRQPTHTRCSADVAPAAAVNDEDVDKDEALRADALRQFRELVSSTDEHLPLLHCAVLIARHRYPDLDESSVVATIANLAAQVREQLGGNKYPLKVLRTINEVLYEQHGFHGNTENYYDVDNSCINAVLTRRTGIPITLSLVYQEVARLVGVPLVGLNLPCHFMLRPALPETEVLVDAYHDGDICYLPDAEALLTKLLGAPVQIDPRFLEPERGISDRLFLTRMLTNLKQIYLLNHQLEPGLWILRYLRAVEPTNKDHLREEGACLYHLGRHTEATAALRLYLQLSPRAWDAPKVQSILDAIAVATDPAAGAERASSLQGGDDWDNIV